MWALYSFPHSLISQIGSLEIFSKNFIATHPHISFTVLDALPQLLVIFNHCFRSQSHREKKESESERGEGVVGETERERVTEINYLQFERNEKFKVSVFQMKNNYVLRAWIYKNELQLIYVLLFLFPLPFHFNVPLIECCVANWSRIKASTFIWVHIQRQKYSS